MLEALKVLNLPPGTRIKENERGDVFILKTCQRTLILGFHLAPLYRLDEETTFDTYQGEDAYQFLLETISGLKSQVLGEYEVVGQFKKAYQDYLALPFKQSQIIQVIEKLFKDSKEIRSKFLMEIGQLSYAGIARKIIHQDILEIDEEKNESELSKILILGTGQLAEDLIKLLKKKNQLVVSGRNLERLAYLKEMFDIEILDWNKRSLYTEFAHIVNTIGTDTILLNQDFFTQWVFKNPSHRLFIDLGSPSVIETPMGKNEGVLRLEDIFKESAKLTHEKMEKIQKAEEHIRFLVQKRRNTFMLTHASSWEELRFESAL